MPDDAFGDRLLAAPPNPSVTPTLSPYVVRVVIPFATGTVDEAVRQATAATAAAIDSALQPVLATIEANRRRARLQALIF